MRRISTKQAKLFMSAVVTAFILSGGIAGWRIYAQEGEWEIISAEITGGYCAGIDSGSPHTVYFGTSKGLYKTDDAGLNWKSILRERGMAVNQIAIDESGAKRVYAATSKGIYASFDEGASWKRLYRGTNAYDADCRAILAHGPVLYAGTEMGLSVSIDSGVRWNKESGELGKIAILALAADPGDSGYIYAAVADGVYRKLIAGGAWEKVFVKRGSAIEDGSDDSADANGDIDKPDESSLLRHICVDPGKTGVVYLATAGGVLKSADSGSTWQDLTQAGLMSKDVRALALGEGSGLYAAAGSDIYVFENGQWRCLSAGTALKLIGGLVCTADSVYAACGSGLYRMRIKYSARETGDGTDNAYIRGIPSIKSVQKAAIEYADADIAKIREWRRQARHKALLPSVDVGINQDTSELWHWEGGSTTREYDDLLRKGKNVYEWDLSLSWDLGELIWNDSQTSIDTRARLLVQLRDDILDEVTKLYFEYVRVRTELDTISILDKKKLAEKEIRLAELAAQLDALTNNFFSK